MCIGVDEATTPLNPLYGLLNNIQFKKVILRYIWFLFPTGTSIQITATLSAVKLCHSCKWEMSRSFLITLIIIITTAVRRSACFAFLLSQ